MTEFYPDAVAASATAPKVAFPVSGEATPEYSSALFVRQLQVAGVNELDAQRAAYFNADLLVRDVEARGVPNELAAVREIDTSLVGHWEDAVADPATSPTAEEYEPSARRLFAHMMNATRAYSPPAELPVRPLHVRGLMHRAVEDARAGWVHDWRMVAAEHAGEADTANSDAAASEASSERGVTESDEAVDDTTAVDGPEEELV